MKMDRGHWIIAGITVALIGYITLYTPVAGYLSQRQAEAAQAAAGAQEAASGEEGADVTTAGSISTGTVLKREGVAVAEIWGMKKITAKGAEVVKFTSHDSADKFREFLQGLRDRETFELIGHELPSQTLTWLADFHDPSHRLYTVETPDGESYEFCGWVRRVKTHGELEGALVFEADVQCTAGPSTREETTVEYYHCTEAPPAPGTSPDDDPDHWEEVPPPDGIEDGEAVFGCDRAGSGWANPPDLEANGTVFPFTHGSPGQSWQTNINTIGDWPSSISADVLLDDTIYAVNCIYTLDTYLPVEIRAFISGTQGSGIAATRGAIYTDEGELVAGSDWVLLQDGEHWYRYDLNASEPLYATASYVLLVEMHYNIMYDLIQLSVGADYTPPDGGEWDPDENYEYCETVAYTTTVEETYCP